MNFTCNKCAFVDGRFDFTKSLHRISQNDTILEKELAATCEKLLLVCFDVQLPSTNCAISADHSSDHAAIDILRTYQPCLLDEVDAISTQSDGNCMYRAVSLALYNTQIHHLHIRLLAAIEILENPEYYKAASPSFLIKDVRVVTATYSDLVAAVITPKRFAELLHIYAVSETLKQPIKSYYPPTSMNGTLTGAFRTNVIGRTVNTHHDPKICLMWSCVNKPSKHSFKPNHFAVLVDKQSNLANVSLNSSGNSSNLSNVSINSNLFQMPPPITCSSNNE